MILKDSKNIFCAVSAGYSSIIMAHKLKEWYPEHNIVYGMANTSKEDEESLIFMDKCDNFFGFKMTWIEAIINQERGKGTDYKITDFKNLKRNGEIFEQGIKKYGIPSKINKWCNRELKLVPIKKFCDNIFGAKNYSIAVGMRADEMDRVSNDYKKNNIFYPLLDFGITTKERNKFWSNKPIQIKIPAR
jgi:3'-phosphoadenosine 5'-phosphosulfate sulfotransferase (PAPS reductase)/FAD synthetase